jgi:hypothetical protein
MPPVTEPTMSALTSIVSGLYVQYLRQKWRK